MEKLKIVRKNLTFFSKSWKKVEKKWKKNGKIEMWKKFHICKIWTNVRFYVITDDFGGKNEKKLKKSGKKMEKNGEKTPKSSVIMGVLLFFICKGDYKRLYPLFHRKSRTLPRVGERYGT